MKWRPEWQDLDAETSSRIDNLNAFDSLTIAWLQRPDERPRLHDQMGEAMYKVHQHDHRLCEQIFERAAIGAEDAVREAYFTLSERFSEIGRLGNDPPVETDESPTGAAVADSSQENPTCNPSGTVNERMTGAMDGDPRRRKWTAAEWAEYLHCSERQVRRTELWQGLQQAKELAKKELAKRR